MEITEEKLFAAFGMEPKDAGGKEPEAAEPAEEQQEQKETGSPRESEEREDDGAADGSDADEPARPAQEGEAKEAKGENAAQSEQTRRENAARRRREEQQRAIHEAVQAALRERDEQQAQEMKDFFAQAKLSNPITGKPIESMEDFRAWQQERDKERIRTELKEGKLTEETLTSLIDRHPLMQQARQEQKERVRREQAETEKAQEREVQRQLAEIRKTDPSIETVADLMTKPYSKALYEAVQRGNNLEDAFYLATRGMKEKATAEAAQQAAVNRIRSKDHLRSSEIGGKAGASISPQEEKMYRLFNPKASADEIQRFQNKYKQGKGAAR